MKFTLVLLTLIIAFCSTTATAALDARVTPKQIDEAIAKAKAFIYSQQHAGGHWENDAQRSGTDHSLFAKMQGDTFGGYTALATYALLASGENPNDPRIRSAIDFLKTADIVGVYAIAMRCQVWLLIPHDSPEMRALIQRDANFLLSGINDGSANPRNKGMWDYLGIGTRLDHSVSQYGVLGLWACQQTGVVDVGFDRWKMMERAWRDQQYSQGGWDYGTQEDQTPSMTAAGIASLFIITDYTRAAADLACAGNAIDPSIDKGLAWLDKNYEHIGVNGYSMYGIERIGAASGYKFFASHDWYQDLSARLLSLQKPDGSFNAVDYPGSRILDATCFGLLFLSRGRAPVMMNKMDYHEPAVGDTVPEPADWNERPRDLANLAVFAGRQAETFLQWQIVNPKVSNEALHDAPIIYLSGDLELKPTPELAEKLKAFVLEGGMILAQADCAKPGFANSAESLGVSMFGYSFRNLQPDHPIFTNEQFPARRWRRIPDLRGLSNGVREFMIVIPDGDPARWWQDPNGFKRHPDAFELGADIFQYSVDRQIWRKGESYVVQIDSKIEKERSMKVARLAIGRNWNPEPAGWSRLAATIHNDDKVELTVFMTTPGDGSLTAAKVAHLTGTDDFKLSSAAALELKTFVDNGGTLIIDAAGGSSAFADAAERELKAMFGADGANGLAQPLSRSDPVYRFGQHPIDNFTYRPWARAHGLGTNKEPRLRGIRVRGRVGVYFSREDISAGLVGEPVDGIDGYSPEIATNIMRNILLFSVVDPVHGRSSK
jgi:hypothetical protein